MWEGSANLAVLFRASLLEFGAVRAEFTNKSLTNDELKCWCKEEWLDLHIHQSRKWIECRIGMKRREYKMSGKRCIYSYGCSLLGSGFSDEDDVGVLSENSFEAEFVGVAFFIIDLRLLETWDFVFNWIFKSDDFFWTIVEFFEGRIESCCFSWSGRTCDNDDSCCFTDTGFQKRYLIWRKSDFLKTLYTFLSVEKSDNDTFSFDTRHKADSGIDSSEISVFVWCLEGKSSILRDVVDIHLNARYEFDFLHIFSEFFVSEF